MTTFLNLIKEGQRNAKTFIYFTIHHYKRIKQDDYNIEFSKKYGVFEKCVYGTNCRDIRHLTYSV